MSEKVGLSEQYRYWYASDMGSGRLGYSSSIVKRKNLKKKRELTDAQLLSQAEQETKKWQTRLRNSGNTVIH